MHFFRLTESPLSSIRERQGMLDSICELAILVACVGTSYANLELVFDQIGGWRLVSLISSKLRLSFRLP